MILVAVGTFIHGFDELVAAADAAAAALGVGRLRADRPFAACMPRHLAWERFLPPERAGERIAQASLVICHGGIGLVGEAMRAGKPIIVVPRRGRPTRASPAGDQTALARRLAERTRSGLRASPATCGAARAMLAAGPSRAATIWAATCRSSSPASWHCRTNQGPCPTKPRGGS